MITSKIINTIASSKTSANIVIPLEAEVIQQGGYDVIYVDPPWSYKFSEPTASKGGAKGSGYSAGVNYYYPLMTIDQLKDMDIKKIMRKDCILFLWATVPLLPEALDLMKHWGFKYKTMITWKKQRCKGMGYWFRGHTEHLLLGIRGDIKAFRSLEHNFLELPVLKHSKKPNEFREMIERATPDKKRIELFARQTVNGWHVWGNEVESDISLAV